MGVNKIFSRKIIAASIISSLLAITVGFWYSITEPFTSIKDFILNTFMVMPVYILFGLPIILVYGVLSSFLSDALSKSISTKLNNSRFETALSLLFHIIFGLVLGWPIAVIALIFFITDQLLQNRRKSYNSTQAIISLAIPLITWLLSFTVISILQ